MEITCLMNELGTRMGLPALELNSLGLARIAVDGRVHVDFEYDPPNDLLYVYSVVGKVPYDEKTPVYQSLLEGNLFCLDTTGATLAVDPRANEVVLCRVIWPAMSNVHGFISMVEAVIEAAMVWAARFEAPPQVENLDSKVMLHQYWRA